MSFILFLSIFTIKAQEYCMTAPTGFGNAATGGTGGTLVTVDNYADLKNYLTKPSSSSYIIIATKDIPFGDSEMIGVTGNKTILGMPGVKLFLTTQTNKSGILALRGNNITFQYCYWAEGCIDRMPRARNAELHILNCYYATGPEGRNGIGLGGGINGTTCYVEGCHFKKNNECI